MKRLFILALLSAFALVPAVIIAAIAFTANIGGMGNRLID